MNYEPSVQHFFESYGYRVEKIPQEEDESPDFLIFDSVWSYLLELKTKFPSEAQIEERRKTLETKNVYIIHEPTIRKNTFSGIIKKAKDQLKKPKAPQDVLRLVWLLVATSDWADAQMHQFEATLYGSTRVVDTTNGRSGDCFFFHNSDFFLFRDVLDAAIVSTESKLKLLLNPLSPRYERMKKSSLSKHLRNAVVDPIQLEKECRAFLVEGDVDRSDKEAVLQHLREKYKSENMADITMNYVSGTMVVPRQTDEI